MIVILEGGDGAGKSTLCNQLQELGAIKVDVKRNTKNHFEQWSKIKQFYKDKLIVSDRSFITDLVYRLQDELNPDDMNLIQMCITLRYDVKIILCETDTSFEDGMIRGEDNITDRSQAENIKKLYNIITTMFSKFLNVPVYKYNWKKQNIDDVIKFIKEVKTNAV